ncbi:MAG: extracellular solute-binding protein [Desulfobacterales bacterium]|nr:extracellular solute-binding protein [Desulfobacterales bacterium]
MVREICRVAAPAGSALTVTASSLLNLMERMYQEQIVFQETGGTHGVALATPEGAWFLLAEDVGRHNAMDKVIGRARFQGRDLSRMVVLLSGRISLPGGDSQAEGGKGMARILLIMSMIGSLFMAANVAAETRIKCASTTSTQNSGLFDYLLPIFEKKTGIKVDVVAVGTGAAIEIGKRGDADVVMVHAKQQELKAVEAGAFVNRHDLMYNDFVIIGPANDPLKIKGMKTAADAFKKISGQKAEFVSRGDKSGTNTKELALWKTAGIDPKGQKWYLEVGQGMEKTQRIANEKRAFTLTDRGTWLATKDKLEMVVVLEGDPVLFNQYGVMAVHPGKHKQVKYKEAMAFVDWLISPEGQKAIGDFKDKSGNQLFTPNAK